MDLPGKRTSETPQATVLDFILATSTRTDMILIIELTVPHDSRENLNNTRSWVGEWWES